MSGAHAHGHSHDRVHGAERGTLTSRAAMASITMALFLVGLKVWAVWDSGSVAMLGSLADTMLDVVASLVTLFAVRYAALPADDEHRFGHGKAEALAALFQVVLISLSAAAIGWRAVNRFGSNAPVEALELGIGVSLVAMAATFALLAYQRLVIRRTGSVAIQADHVHYQSDLLLNGGVIAALMLDSQLGWRWADPLFGLIIALWLGWGAWRAALGAVDQLMDKEWAEDKKAQLIALANAHPEATGLHDLRTRTSGGQDFAQFHVWVDPAMTVLDAHRIMDEIEAELMAAFPGAEILIHPDPRGHTDELGYIPSETVEHHDHAHD
jgi:ferrous-iron efflux pump FieF